MGVNVKREVLGLPVRHLKCQMGPPTRIRGSGWSTGAPLANRENVVPDGPDTKSYSAGEARAKNSYSVSLEVRDSVMGITIID